MSNGGLKVLFRSHARAQDYPTMIVSAAYRMSVFLRRGVRHLKRRRGGRS
jgi:hypothetical protein